MHNSLFFSIPCIKSSEERMKRMSDSLVRCLCTAIEISKNPAGKNNKNNHFNKLNPVSFIKCRYTCMCLSAVL